MRKTTEFHIFCQTCSHNILRNITSSIRCRTIYFRAVFSRKSSAAMPCHTTIGIYNNLASCYTTIAVRTAYDKTPCWIDEKFCVLIYQFCWNNRFQYIFFISSWICSCVTSGSCCVDRTTASSRCGIPASSYSTVT